jgi:cell fate regulator YaaT (PSP1 superfamily)
MDITRIRVRKPTRVFDFLCENIALDRDDACVVRSERGLEYGEVVLPPEPCPAEIAKRTEGRVVRKITLADEGTLHSLAVDERKALDICKEKVAQHRLPMKLVDAEYTFDKHKVVFYFTAADRVDFRQLVRDLAQDLKTRIELRHIQVRDEAKIVGGIGVCGRELCCSTWLTEFKPVSMKMAKRQNLSLNPTKISGQCGRLLCCLTYENEMYPGRRKPPAALPVEEPVPDVEEILAAAEEEADAEDETLDIIVESADEEAQAPEADGEKPKRKRRRRKRSKRPEGNPQGENAP